MTKLVESIFQTNYKSQAVAAEEDEMILLMHLTTYGIGESPALKYRL